MPDETDPPNVLAVGCRIAVAAALGLGLGWLATHDPLMAPYNLPWGMLLWGTDRRLGWPWATTALILVVPMVFIAMGASHWLLKKIRDALQTQRDAAGAAVGLLLVEMPPPNRLAMGFHIILAAAMGLGLGWLATHDAVIGRYHPFWGMLTGPNQRISWPWTATAAGFLVIGLIVAITHRWVFEHRYRAIVLLLVVPIGFAGVNISFLDPSDPALMLVCTFWFVASLIEKKPIQIPPVVAAFLFGLATCAIASAVNGRTLTIIGLHNLISKLVLVFLMTNFISTVPLSRLAFRAFIAIAVFSALVAIASEAIYVFTGYRFSFDDAKEIQIKSTPLGYLLRSTAFSTTPQSLGHLLVLGLSLMLMMPARPIVRILCVPILVAGVVTTLSAGAFLSAGVTIILALFMWRPAWSIHFVVVAAAVTLIAYLTGSLELLYDKVLFPIGGESLNDRIEYIRNGMPVILDHPWVGIGYRNIARVLGIEIHNAYLQMTAETGIPGGLLFTGLIAYLIFGCALAARQAEQFIAKQWLKGLALGMVALSIQCQVEPLYNNVVTWSYMGLAASAIGVYGKIPPQNGDENER